MRIGLFEPTDTKTDFETRKKRIKSIVSSHKFKIVESKDDLDTRTWKIVLAMLIDMMQSLEYSKKVIQNSMSAYGYSTAESREILWDNNQLEKYLTGRLTERMSKEGYTFFLLITPDEKIIGVVSGNIKSSGMFELLNLVVRKDFRGQGVFGAALLACVIDALYKKGVTEVTVSLSPLSQKKNLHFYRTLSQLICIKYEEGTLPERPTNYKCNPRFYTTNCLEQIQAIKVDNINDLTF